jgi:ribosomal-protein-alanine N-acetyltransferase
MIIKQQFSIITPRFGLRSLEPNDDLDIYLSWMKDVINNQYILSVRSDYSMEELINYVDTVNCLSNAVLLGIFEKKSNAHIGNIKYSKINSPVGSAEMGIMIGQKELRGHGVAAEVIRACNLWLKTEHLIELIELGVNSDNKPALSLYRKLGFKQLGPSTSIGKTIKMALLL